LDEVFSLKDFFILFYFSVLLVNRRTKPDDCRRPFVPFDRTSQDSRVCERPVYVAVVKKKKKKKFYTKKSNGKKGKENTNKKKNKTKQINK
jgi:hypothetical protein